MKVILLSKIAGLGDIDDVVDVAEGFASNYLFPKHLAVLASTKNINQVSITQTKKQKEMEKDLKEQQSIASRLDGLSLSIQEKANEAGFFYAAIGGQRICQELSDLGFEISKNQIQLSSPIKEPGEYKIKIKLRHNLEAVICLTASVR